MANPIPRGSLYGRHVPGRGVTLYPGDIFGDMYFVDSTNGASTNSGEDPAAAMATIDQAVDKCTASHDDVIVVAPYHAENLAADSAVDVDLAGVHVVGIRRGRQMPTLTATAIAGDFKLAAANCSVSNIRFLGGIDATTGILEVSGADCGVYDCEYRDSVDQATVALITTAAADRLHIKGYRHLGAAAAGADSAMDLIGADDAVVEDFYVYGNFANAGISSHTTASLRIHIHTGTIWTANAADLAIEVDTVATTGFIGPDINIMLTDNAANITTAVTAAACQLIDPVYVCNLAGEKGMLINWTASTD